MYIHSSNVCTYSHNYGRVLSAFISNSEFAPKMTKSLGHHLTFCDIFMLSFLFSEQVKLNSMLSHMNTAVCAIYLAHTQVCEMVQWVWHPQAKCGHKGCVQCKPAKNGQRWYASVDPNYLGSRHGGIKLTGLLDFG